MSRTKKCAMYLSVAVAFSMVILFSCTTPIQRKTMFLTPRMHESDVRLLFKKYVVVAEWTGADCRANRKARIFKQDSDIKKTIRFISPYRSVFDFHALEIYFDINNQVVGYYYDQPS